MNSYRYDKADTGRVEGLCKSKDIKSMRIEICGQRVAG